MSVESKSNMRSVILDMYMGMYAYNIHIYVICIYNVIWYDVMSCACVFM